MAKKNKISIFGNFIAVGTAVFYMYIGRSSYVMRQLSMLNDKIRPRKILETKSGQPATNHLPHENYLQSSPWNQVNNLQAYKVPAETVSNNFLKVHYSGYIARRNHCEKTTPDKFTDKNWLANGISNRFNQFKAYIKGKYPTIEGTKDRIKKRLEGTDKEDKYVKNVKSELIEIKKQLDSDPKADDKLVTGFVNEFGKNYSQTYAYEKRFSEVIDMEYEKSKAKAIARFQTERWFKWPMISLVTIVSAYFTYLVDIALENRREMEKKLTIIRKSIYDEAKNHVHLRALFEEVRIQSYSFVHAPRKFLTLAEHHELSRKTAESLSQYNEIEKLLDEVGNNLPLSKYTIKSILSSTQRSEISKQKAILNEMKKRLEQDRALNRGIVHAMAKEYDDAESEFENSKESNKVSKTIPDPYIGKGAILFFKGMQADTEKNKNKYLIDSEEEIKKGIKLSPEQSNVCSLALNNLGYFYKEVADYKETKNLVDLAEKYFKAAIKADPVYTLPRRNLADLYNKKGEYQKALDEIDSALLLQSTKEKEEKHILLANKADILINLSKFKEAEKCLEEANSIFNKRREKIEKTGEHITKEEYFDSYNLRAKLYFFTKKLDECKASLEKADKENDNIVKFITAKIIIDEQSGEIDEAISLLGSALKSEPRNTKFAHQIKEELIKAYSIKNQIPLDSKETEHNREREKLVEENSAIKFTLLSESFVSCKSEPGSASEKNSRHTSSYRL